MHATLNTFPPFQSMNSPRGWVLAAIVLLHAGFFWLLSSGMGSRIVEVVRGPGKIVIVETPPPPPEPERIQTVKHPIEIPIDLRVRPPEPLPLDEVPAVRSLPPESTSASGSGPTAGSGVGPSTTNPLIVQPDIDPNVRLSEPLYPASEIRAEHTGTVLLSLWVLENGRVGEVRLDQSSGWKKLDDSAIREARRWRFKPGMRDGIATAMWKQIPVTFQLKSEGGRH